jgi:hypothetical protein
VAEYGGDLIDAIEMQIEAQRPPCLTFTHETDQGSLLIYAGNREFALSQGIALPDDKAGLYAIVMPLGCDDAQRIERSFQQSAKTITLDPDEFKLSTVPVYELN